MSKESDPKNIVPPENALHHPDGAFDDPIYDYWEKNKKSFFTTAVLVVVVAALFFGYRSYRESQFQRLQQNYLAAWAGDRLPEFADQAAGAPLGGVAAMQAARLSAVDGDLAEAARLYEMAVRSLQRTALEGKARLALAATLFEQGKTQEAERQWGELAKNAALNAAVRSEAAYLLAMSALAAGDRALFEQRVEQLAAVDTMGLWRERIAFYETAQPIPEMKPAVAETAESEEAPAIEESAVEEQSTEGGDEIPAEEGTLSD